MISEDEKHLRQTLVNQEILLEAMERYPRRHYLSLGASPIETVQRAINQTKINIQVVRSLTE